jgi:nucleotide-binding universal stress UspA family protein
MPSHALEASPILRSSGGLRFLSVILGVLSKVENEQPYKTIITTAKNKGCDLIVMASHGRSGLSAVVLDSVTNKC